ncbi:MAG: hypothetical protein IT361_09320 [Gemmatimonadaceae bacterium]|nr:hypothetical protein [Gemmatimonadaceae bacterium]
MKGLALVLALCSSAACVPPASSPSQGTAPSGSSTARRDTLALIPAGYGTLKQDDIAIRVQQFGLQVRAIPLDESVIRVLSPDSYRALSELLRSQSTRLDEIRRRTAYAKLSVWYVSFFGVELGEARYSPMEIIVTNVGRDFRPVDVVALSPGFGRQRVRQREVQNALYVFDGQLDVNQPLVVAYETARSSSWPTVLERIERERVLVRSRVRQP